MRNWTIATLIAVIILTSPFTVIGMSLVGGVMFHGEIFFDNAKDLFQYLRDIYG